MGKYFAKIESVCRVRLVASEEWDSFRYARKKGSLTPFVFTFTKFAIHLTDHLGLSGEQIRPDYDLPPVCTRLPCSADNLAFTISHSAARAEVACSAASDG